MKNDLVGKRFGKLTVLSKTDEKIIILLTSVHTNHPTHGISIVILPHVGWCRCTHILFNSLHTLH